MPVFRGINRSRIKQKNRMLSSRVKLSGPLVAVIFGFMTVSSSGQQTGGDFKSRADIGNCRLPGSMVYDPAGQTYLLTGAGENIWFGRDRFYFAWTSLKGDFILRTRMEFVGEGGHPHRKGGLMIRAGEGTGAPHVSGVVHGNGLTSLQYRKQGGGMTEEIVSANKAPAILQLERRGDLGRGGGVTNGWTFWKTGQS